MSDPPAQIGRYQVHRLLGEGGQGMLYLATDPVLDRQVALKLLRVDSADLRRRLVREAQAAARIQHPNIVTVYDVGDHDGQLYLAMEYIDGDTLAALIRDNVPFSPIRKLDIVDEIAEGLGYAHQRGIVHRDVKPANLMITRTGLVKVLDFGIARAAQWQTGELESASLIGTPAYMAPEQLEGAEADARTDIYAVGLVMYEIFARTRAFGGATTEEVLERVLAAQPIPLDTLAPDIDPELARIVARAMARQPGQRYPDLQAMRKDLARVRRRAMQATADEATIFAPLASVAPARRGVDSTDAAQAPVPAAQGPPPLPPGRTAPPAAAVRAAGPAAHDSGPVPVPLPVSIASIGLPASAGGATVAAAAADHVRSPIAPGSSPSRGHTTSPFPDARPGIPAAVLVGGVLAVLACVFLAAFFIVGGLVGETSPSLTGRIAGLFTETSASRTDKPPEPTVEPSAAQTAVAPAVTAPVVTGPAMTGPAVAGPTATEETLPTPSVDQLASPPDARQPRPPRPISPPVDGPRSARAAPTVADRPPEVDARRPSAIVPPPASEASRDLAPPSVTETPDEAPVRRAPEPPAAPRDEALTLVRGYVAARNTSHAGGIRRVWPGVDDLHIRRVTSAFAAPLTLSSCDVDSIDTSRATATCTLTQPGTTGAYASAQPLTIRRTFVFELAREGRAWVIAGLRE